MSELGVRDAFHALIGADSLPVRKPEPAPVWEAIHRAGGSRARACLVGDTHTDRAAATAAGIPSILVTFGPSGPSTPALSPEALLHDFADLDAIVDDLLGV